MADCQCHSIYLTENRKLKHPAYEFENDPLVYNIIYSQPAVGREHWEESDICLQLSIFLD